MPARLPRPSACPWAALPMARMLACLACLPTHPPDITYPTGRARPPSPSTHKRAHSPPIWSAHHPTQQFHTIYRASTAHEHHPIGPWPNGLTPRARTNDPTRPLRLCASAPLRLCASAPLHPSDPVTIDTPRKIERPLRDPDQPATLPPPNEPGHPLELAPTTLGPLDIASEPLRHCPTTRTVAPPA